MTLKWLLGIAQLIVFILLIGSGLYFVLLQNDPHAVLGLVFIVTGLIWAYAVTRRKPNQTRARES